MKKIYNLIGVLLLVLIVKTGIAQQQIPYSLYPQNRMLINPANTGDFGQAFLNYRNQWATLDGNPTAYTFGIQNAIGANKNMGLGLMVQREEYGAFQKTNGQLNYSYNVKLNEKNHLAFGLGAGFRDNRIKNSESILPDSYTGQGELNEIVGDYESANFSAAFGMKYDWNQKLEVAFAMPQLFEENGYKLKKSFIGLASYKINAIPDKLTVEPSIMYRTYGYEGYSTDYMDVNVNMCWNKMAWVGGSFRTNENSVAISAGVNLFNINIGYAYQFFVDAKPKAGLGATHEVQIAYTFKKEKANEELLTNDLVELAMNDSTTVVPADYQNQIDSLSKEIETLKMLLQVKDLKTWADGFKDKIRDLESMVNDAKGCMSSDGFKRHILFEEDKADLNPTYFTVLDSIAECTKAGEFKLEVVGHTNDNGGVAHNQALSEKRANIVADHLISRGVAKERLIIVGRGMNEPMFENKTAKGKAMNRRVQFRIVK